MAITAQMTPDFPIGAHVQTPFGDGSVVAIADTQRAYSVRVNGATHAFQFGDKRVSEKLK